MIDTQIKKNTGPLGKHWKLSQETKDKMSATRLRLKTMPPRMVTSKYRLWFENQSEYNIIHAWMRKTFGTPNQCECCGKIAYGRFIHWANKSGEYKKERDDWSRLCAKCHKKVDLVNLTPILS